MGSKYHSSVMAEKSNSPVDAMRGILYWQQMQTSKADIQLIVNRSIGQSAND